MDKFVYNSSLGLYTNSGDKHCIVHYNKVYMRKFILGIISVILLQIAFGIYFANDASLGRGPEITESSPNAGALPVAPVLDRMKDSGNVEESPIAVTTDIGSENVAIEPRRAGGQPSRHAGMPNLGSRAKVFTRKPMAAYNLRAIQPRVQREYFGSMVVERSFGISTSRIKNGTANVRKQFFGKMMVERRFEISSNRTTNISKTKKSSYLAKSLPVNKKPGGSINTSFRS